MIKRAAILVGFVLVVSSVVLLFTYDVLKVDFIGFMEIQPSYGPMERPLPVPARSIPIEGPAYIPGLGAPENPVDPDKISIERGRVLFSINCVQCHGDTGEGNGAIANFLVSKKPADLTNQAVQEKSDGSLFLVLSNGVPDTMPLSTKT